MKKSILIILFIIIPLQFIVSQSNEKIVVKGDYVLINEECKVSVDNSGRQYLTSKIMIKKEAVLSIVIFKKRVIISSSELHAALHTSHSKIYEFEFNGTISAEAFFDELSGKLGGA